ncbi:putative mitochondrial protein [Glycine soja]
MALMQSYPARALDRKLQVDWARDAREGPRVLMSLRTYLLLEVASPLSLPSPFRCHLSSKKQRNPLMKKILGLQAPMELASCGIRASSSSVNGEGSTPKDPLYKILDELRSLKLWKEKQERKEKGKKRVEEISQDEREKIREEERRKIMKEMKREKHVSYSSHNSCKSLSEELRDYYEGRHRSHLRPHSHRRENERKPQEVNIKLPYFHGKDNVEANLDWEKGVEQQLKRKSTSKSYGSHSYQKKDQGQGILGVRPSKPKDDKGKTTEKQPLKASMQEKTSSMKCFKCLGRGHITSQCPTKKTMIMRGQDIYSSQDEATTSPSSSKSEEAKGEESSEEIYPQEEGQPLMVKEECKEVSVSSKRLAKKERHFEIKTNIKEISLLRQPPHFLLCKKTLVSIATSLRLEFNPQVKELLDEGLVRKRLNPCALLVPKIGIIRHQIPKIGGVMNVLGGATLFCKITRAPNIFMICVHRDSLGSFNTNLGTHMGHLRFVILFGRNNQHENTEKGVPMNPKRIKVIPEWPAPPSVRKIWGFQDLTNFYKRFAPYFSILVAPLIELVRNHVPSWEDAQEMSVEEKSPAFQEPQDLSGVSSLSSFSIPLPFIFQEAKESIDEEDPRPTSSNGACINSSGDNGVTMATMPTSEPRSGFYSEHFDIYIAYFRKLAPTDAEKREELELEKRHANRGRILAFQKALSPSPSRFFFFLLHSPLKPQQSSNLWSSFLLQITKGGHFLSREAHLYVWDLEISDGVPRGSLGDPRRQREVLISGHDSVHGYFIDEPARTLQRTVEWILPTPTPYRLVEPVQVIEVTSSEEDLEEDLEELPPEPAVDALDFLEGDEDLLPEVESPEDVMSASEADSTEDSGPGEMAISGGSSS